MEKFSTMISAPIEGSMTVEIYHEDGQWADITREKSGNKVAFFDHPEKKCWEFSCSDAIKMLTKAQSRLMLKKNANMGAFVANLPSNAPDPEELNRQGEELLEAIVNHPKQTVVTYTHKLYGPVIEIEAPGLGGVRTCPNYQKIDFFDHVTYII